MSAQGFLPQMRNPPTMGARGLSVGWTVVGDLGLVALRGAVDPDNLDVLLGAIDAAIGSGIRALVLDGDEVDFWSIRGLEVVVGTATRAELSRGVAISGLSTADLDVIRRQWPGVPVDRFEFADASAATAAFVPAGTMPVTARRSHHANA